MQAQPIALLRWLSWHRRQLATGTALIIGAALLVTAGPLLVTVAAVEWKHGRRRRRRLGLALTIVLARSVVWLWRDLSGIPHGDWHPCARCRSPIEAPSRAWYCSPACRRYARLERDVRAFDPWIAERASGRLRAIELRPQADMRPEWGEVPF
jgi:hypothetical protein